MHASIILGIVGAVLGIGLVAVLISIRRRRPEDLGEVSAAWTTAHNVGYRGGDGSTS